MIEGDGLVVTMWRAVIVHATREGDREWFDGAERIEHAFTSAEELRAAGNAGASYHA